MFDYYFNWDLFNLHFCNTDYYKYSDFRLYIIKTGCMNNNYSTKRKYSKRETISLNLLGHMDINSRTSSWNLNLDFKNINHFNK